MTTEVKWHRHGALDSYPREEKRGVYEFFQPTETPGARRAAAAGRKCILGAVLGNPEDPARQWSRAQWAARGALGHSRERSGPRQPRGDAGNEGASRRQESGDGQGGVGPLATCSSRECGPRRLAAGPPRTGSGRRPSPMTPDNSCGSVRAAVQRPGPAEGAWAASASGEASLVPSCPGEEGAGPLASSRSPESRPAPDSGLRCDLGFYGTRGPHSLAHGEGGAWAMSGTVPHSASRPCQPGEAGEAGSNVG